MPSSKIIRDRQYNRQAKPLTLEEAEANALYQSVWIHTNSNIIRDATDIPVRTFPLFDPSTTSHTSSSRQPGVPDAAAAPQDPDTHDASQAELLAKAEEQAQVLVQQAREEAERCLAEAHVQAAQLETEAYEAGLRRGETDALQESRQRYASILGCFEQAVAEITGLRRQVVQQAEDDIITLAFEIARKLVHHHVLVDHECLAMTLRRALSYVFDDDAVVVRVHPDDLAQTQQLHDEIRSSFETTRRVTIETDETIGRGGCVVEASVGVIDARITSQFAELEQRFREQYTLRTEGHVQ